MPRLKVILPLLVVFSLLLTTVAGCGRTDDFNSQVDAITAPYSFGLFKWEVDAVGGVVKDIFNQPASDNIDVIAAYFGDMQCIQSLETQMDGATLGSSDEALAQKQLNTLEERCSALAEQVVAQLKVKIEPVLKQDGIDNPFNLTSSIFPPIEAVLANSPNLLVISPRDHIETVKQVTLLPDMSRDEMVDIEAKVKALGYSALVVPLGGMATYPSYVTNEGGLQFTIESIVHEWLHQYLAFTPLGFRYVLDRAGIREDYDIATMNETVVSMVAKEIGAEVYHEYVPGNTTDNETSPPAGFDFNKVMRETRTTVDKDLAAGQIDQAEQYMEQQRQYLAANGYIIRKLNQAYFAFYGAYADSPTSVSPIGVELKTLRGQSASLKDFLDTVSKMTSPQDLKNEILNSKS